MTDNMLMGAFLVLVALTLFLEFRIAFWVMVGIPVCFLGALALLPLPWFGVSINMISLFGFILVLGIVWWMMPLLLVKVPTARLKNTVNPLKP